MSQTFTADGVDLGTSAVRAGEISDATWASAAMLGVMAGLSAGGLYDATRSVTTR